VRTKGAKLKERLTGIPLWGHTGLCRLAPEHDLIASGWQESLAERKMQEREPDVRHLIMFEPWLGSS
jgi:hypothetical protein